MFREEQKRVNEAISQSLVSMGYEPRIVELRRIPFSGAWGFATSVCYQLARDELSQTIAEISHDLPKKQAKQEVERLVRERTQALAEKMKDILAGNGSFGRVEAVNGYVNIYFDTADFASRVVREAVEKGSGFGQGEPKGERVMVEYSQPNTHKAFHIGHLRNLCLGSALSNILRHYGYDIVEATYPGDIGLHVIKCLWCYRRFHAGEEPDDNKGLWLGQVYVEATAKLSYREDVFGFLCDLARSNIYFADKVREFLRAASGEGWSQETVKALEYQILTASEPDVKRVGSETLLRSLWLAGADWLSEAESLLSDAIAERMGRYLPTRENVELWDNVEVYNAEVKDLFQAWERKDPELMELWRRTRQWSLDEFMSIYAELGVKFDVWFTESGVEEAGREIVRELLDRGVAEISEGVPVVKIDEKLGLTGEKYRTLPILRSDGTTLYSTKDLALAKQKFEEYDVDRSVYVVDVRQSLYFQQIFQILRLWGFSQADKCYHLPYEIVTLPEGQMASRQGNVILYEDFRDELIGRAKLIVDTKNPDLTEEQRREIARVVAFGAMKYSMLDVDNNKTIVFDWEEALNFDGRSAPYIQYSYARASRILEKAGEEETASPDFSHLESAEINLVEQIASFETEVERAAQQYKPLYVAVHVYELAKTFNDFYRVCPVLKADPTIRASRLGLVAAARQTLANGLSLLGIESPEYM